MATSYHVTISKDTSSVQLSSEIRVPYHDIQRGEVVRNKGNIHDTSIAIILLSQHLTQIHVGGGEEQVWCDIFYNNLYLI